MFSALWVKLAASGLLLALIAGAYFYVTNLQENNKQLREDKVLLEQSNQALEKQIEEEARRKDITDKVTDNFDRFRQENRTQRDTQRQRINENVTQGKDQPVGPLLQEFFNER